MNYLGTSDSPLTVDIWDTHNQALGWVVIPVNLSGVHGRGLAYQAKQRGLINGQNRDIATSPPSWARLLTFAVKGWAPETARVKGKAFSEKVTGRNLDLMGSQMDLFLSIASSNPERVYHVPMMGLGFGEGSKDEILPILRRADSLDNIVFVQPPADVVSKYELSFRPGSRRDSRFQ